MIPCSVSLTAIPTPSFSRQEGDTKATSSLPSAKTTATGDQRQSSLLRFSLMTRRRHKVNDYVNRLKEILATVPPACCMELPYFHAKVFFLKSDIS
ncbi:hypothetical protein DY000_02009873 [Brassica cretica]|uniref:BHLH domain-containing protein n=1 Tax=Brassica cretica TaxID=69181 RepID=A0ABQ7CFK5_BRACR|nr:hypothetical protein DY000_02009873 [Brassica cretica]